jgi:hypothetical protein
MKKEDYLLLLKKNIARTYIKCHDDKDPKSLLNYENTIQIEFKDDCIVLKGYSGEFLLDIPYQEIDYIDFKPLQRYGPGTIVRKNYSIMYTIVLHNSTLYQFESMSLQIWNEIINILKENNVNIVDSYALIDIILHSKSTEDFYQSIEQHIEEWKQNNLAMIIKKNNLITKP